MCSSYSAIRLQCPGLRISSRVGFLLTAARSALFTGTGNIPSQEYLASELYFFPYRPERINYLAIPSVPVCSVPHHDPQRQSSRDKRTIECTAAVRPSAQKVQAM